MLSPEDSLSGPQPDRSGLGGVGPFPVVSNRRRGEGGSPVLSVLVPFYDADPLPLLRSLAAQAAGRGDRIEFLLADDGSPDAGYGRAVEAEIAGLDCPAALLTADRNVGRARIRNALAREARGSYLLFVDCDLKPGGPDFLARWLAVAEEGGAEEGRAEIAYGGFVMDPDGSTPDPLHAYYSSRSDCLPAAQRQADPAKYTYTNNLLVRRSALLETLFDERFTGWGWEDVEWALRAAARSPILHIDNPVANPATASAKSLLRKFAESVGNFALLLRLHRAEVETYPIYRASRIAYLIPLAALAMPLLESVALDVHEIFPLSLRYYALKFYRACLYRSIHDIDEA